MVLLLFSLLLLLQLLLVLLLLLFLALLLLLLLLSLSLLLLVALVLLLLLLFVLIQLMQLLLPLLLSLLLLLLCWDCSPRHHCFTCHLALDSAASFSSVGCLAGLSSASNKGAFVCVGGGGGTRRELTVMMSHSPVAGTSCARTALTSANKGGQQNTHTKMLDSATPECQESGGPPATAVDQLPAGGHDHKTINCRPLEKTADPTRYRMKRERERESCTIRKTPSKAQ